MTTLEQVLEITASNFAVQNVQRADSELTLAIKDFHLKQLQLELSTHLVMAEKHKVSIGQVK